MVRILGETLLARRHRAREGCGVAAEASEHVRAHDIVEALRRSLRVGRAGHADGKRNGDQP
jgi:hypothetical protein